MKAMNAEIVSIGTEILLGELVDTNANYIAQQLRNIGINVFYITAVGDNRQRIAETLRLGLSRSDLVITTGGLGPTVDDMTRQAVADATGRELEFKQHLLEQIATKFAAFGVPMSENNRQQAYVPSGSIIFENEVGTAPSFAVESDDGIIVCLPGVPREMKYLLAQKIIPYLRNKMGEDRIIKSLILRTAGIGESVLGEKIADLMLGVNPTVGLSAHIGQTDIRVTALADNEQLADKMILDMEGVIRGRVGKYIYGTGTDPIELAVIDALLKCGKSLVIVEVGTGEALWKRLNDVSTDIVAEHLSYLDFDEARDALGISVEHEIDVLLAISDNYLADDVLCVLVGVSSSGLILVRDSYNLLKREYDFDVLSAGALDWVVAWSLGMVWRFLVDFCVLK